MRRLTPALLTCALAALDAHADPAGRAINPASLGPNAVPLRAGEAASVSPTIDTTLQIAGQWSTPVGGGDDFSTEPVFRASLPIGRHVGITLDGAPFELWRYSPETRALWLPQRSKGICRADIAVGIKVWLFEQRGRIPDLATRVTVTTATGEDLRTRRYLDAPAFQMDALASWARPVGPWTMEAWLALGFYTWQQGQAGQNDAIFASLTGVARYEGLLLKVELRGYHGWESGDRPFAAMFGAEYALSPNWTLTTSVARTFVDPPSLDVRFGARFRLPAGALATW